MSKLSPDQWQALSPHLDEALEMTGDERAIWLSSFQGENPTLAYQLEVLRREHRILSAVVNTKLRKVARYLHDAASPGAPPEGSTPNAVALTSRWQASAGSRSRQQCRRRLRCGYRQVARARSDRLVSHRDRRSRWSTPRSLRKRTRHQCQPRLADVDSAVAAKSVLRHSNMSTTMEHYIKSVDASAVRAMDKISVLFDNANGSGPPN